jgi:hypothetical protein
VFNDKKGAIVKKGVHRVTLGPCVTLAQKIQGQMAAPWTYCYMKHVLCYSEGTLRSMMLAFDPEVRTMLDECAWDPDTWTVSWSAYTPQESGHSSLETRLSRHNIDLEALDLSTLLSDKAKVDKEMDEDEVKAREKMIEEERLYADPAKQRVGASGASARTETKEDDISKAPSGAASTASENLRVTHRSDKLKIAQTNDINAVYADALRKAGIDPATIFAAHQAAGQEEYASDEGSMDPRACADEKCEHLGNGDESGDGDSRDHTDEDTDEDDVVEVTNADNAGRPGQSAPTGQTDQSTGVEV